MSLTLPYPVVADLDDRIKATYWELIDELKDRHREGG